MPDTSIQEKNEEEKQEQKDEVKELVLYDITEQKVKKMELAEEINISHLAAGAYLLKGVKGNKTETLLLRFWKK